MDRRLSSNGNGSVASERNSHARAGSGEELWGCSPIPGAPLSDAETGDNPLEFFAGEEPTEGSRTASANRRRQKSPDAPRRRPGRPRVLDAASKQLVCGLIRFGVSRRRVAAYLGCHHKTIANEARRDPRFARQLKKSEIKAELEPLGNLYHATRTNWRAAAWLLKRIDAQRNRRRAPGDRK